MPKSIVPPGVPSRVDYCVTIHNRTQLCLDKDTVKLGDLLRLRSFIFEWIELYDKLEHYLNRDVFFKDVYDICKVYLDASLKYVSEFREDLIKDQETLVQHKPSCFMLLYRSYWKHKCQQMDTKLKYYLPILAEIEKLIISLDNKLVDRIY